MTKWNACRDLERLPDHHRRIVEDLRGQFGAVAHDLWKDGKPNAAPSRTGFLRAVRKRLPDELTAEELDYITFAALTTMGGPAALKFVLPRFFAAYFAD